MTAQLSSTDAMRLLDAVGSLHDVADPAQFPEAALTAVESVVRSDVSSYNEIDGARGTVVAVARPAEAVFSGAEQILARRAAEHPLIARIRRTGDGSAYRITDVVPHQQFRRMPVYLELYRPMGVEHQMAFALPALRPHVTGIAVNRCARDDDFDDRERAVLNLLRPHLAQAQRRVREQAALATLLRTAARAVTATGGHVVLLGSPAPVELTAGALALLSRYFGPAPRGGGLPPQLADWLAAQPPQADTEPAVRRPASVEREGRRLVVRLLRGPGSPDALLLQERTVVPSLAELATIGLSRRESQVLRLLVAGRSNAEIAAELFIAAGTVRKHLDNLYRKLGVYGRGEAVWAALDLLSGADASLDVVTLEALGASVHPRLG